MKLIKKIIALFNRTHYYLECEDYNKGKKESWKLYYGSMSTINKAIPELQAIRPNIKFQIKTYIVPRGD